jgi:UDPglucose 6-dehydrogenase
MSQTVSVIGAGYVGLTTATLLAESGYKVYVVDVNEERLKTIRSGKSFFYEDGLDPLVKHAVDNKSLVPTSSYEESIPSSQFVFSCVGTPDNPDGSSNLTYVFKAAEQAAALLKDGSIYIQKSTVPVGTGDRVEKEFQKVGKSISYISNPEFLREGTAIGDTLWFDRIVVGGNDKAAVENVMGLYKTIEKHRAEIAKRAGIEIPKRETGSYIDTNRNSAELIKVTANAFLALKISFANSIAKLADHTGADVNEVMDAVGADRRIGRAFLNAGRGYGGGCFPKDVSGLIASATEHSVDMPIMVAATDVNETMPGYIAEKALDKLGSLKDKQVAVLGLAFKAGTSDARRSPGVKLANILARSGAKVCAYDPKANDEAKEELRRDVNICKSIDEATDGAEAVFIATEWQEFTQINLSKLKTNMKGNLFVDGMNLLDKDKAAQAGLEYIGVGR